MTVITDPLPALLVERDRLDAAAAAADLAGDSARQKALEKQAFIIEAKMSQTRATSLDGILAQLTLLVIDGFADMDYEAVLKSLVANIRGAAVELVAREART